MDSPTRLFLARGLRFVETDQEGTEVLRCVPMPLAEAVQKVMDSEITHGSSALLILKAHLLLGSGD